MKVNDISWNILREDEMNSINLKANYIDNKPDSLEIEVEVGKSIVLRTYEIKELFGMLESFIEEVSTIASPKTFETKSLSKFKIQEKKLEHSWCISKDNGNTVCFRASYKGHGIEKLEIELNEENVTLTLSESSTTVFFE